MHSVAQHVLLAAMFAAGCTLLTTDSQTVNITVTPNPVVGTHGENLTLTCNTPHGDSNTTYVWMRNASVELCSTNCSANPTDASALLGDNAFILRIFEANGENLTLTLDASEHGGAVYDCVAIIDDDAFTKTVTVRVAPAIVEHPMDQRVSQGDNVTLTCRAESYPQPTYQWMKFNTSSDSYEELVGETSTSLVFTEIQNDQFGVYRCVATNTIEMTDYQAVSNNATITVSPTALAVPMSSTVNHGGTATFTCSAEGGPDNVFRWLYNGTERLCSSNCTTDNSSIDINEVLNSATNLLQSNTSVLNVSNINATQNGGVYECVVINDAGFSVARSTLYVSPMIVEHPMDQATSVGMTVTFRCRAESFPYPQYQWQKYNTANEMYEDITGADQPDYEIGPVMYSDYGYYRCKVTAPVINETVYSNNATLTVSPEGSVTVGPPSVTVNTGDSASFTCSAQGGPGNAIFWIRSSEVPATRNFTTLSSVSITMEAVLNITSVNATEDGGRYECVVINAAGSSDQTVTLNVRPNFIEHPMDMEPSTGDNITLSCRAESFPSPQYRWEMMNRTTNMFEPVTGATSNVLELDSIEFSNFGMYRCCATAPVINEEMCSNNATVTVHPMGGVTVTPARGLVATGGDVNLTCATEAGPMNMFQWRHMPSDTMLTAVLSTDMMSVLTVSNATAMDQGMYVCTASNEAGNYSQTAVVVVSPSGNSASVPMNNTVNYGETATFTCSAEGGPDNVFQWFYNGTERLCSGNCTTDNTSIDINEVINSTSNLLLTNTSVLTVDNINATQNGGVYECVVLNDAGFSVVRSTLYVNPMIVEHPMDQLTMNGTSITLTCRAESFPYPRYQWQKYNTVTQMYDDITGANDPDYTIDPVIFGHYGYYRCRATAPVINEMVYSNNATVTVSPSGSVTVSPANHTVSHEEPMVTFTCSHQGGPDNRIVWLKNGTSVACGNCSEMPAPVFNLTAINISAVVVGMDTTLNISTVTATEDGGSYECVVINDAGFGVATGNLYVRPNFIEHPMDTEPSTGDNITLSCRAESFPFPQYRWEMMNRTTNMFEPVTGATSNMLELNSIEFSDFGMYRCCATAPDPVNAELCSNNATVTVHPMGGVTVTPARGLVATGGDVNLTCTTEAGPMNMFQWRHMPSDTMLTAVLTTDMMSVLTVPNATAMDQGMYVCTASNEAGNYSQTAVVVVSPSTISEVSQIQITVNDGESINVTCSTRGGPNNVFQWFYNGTERLCSGNCTIDNTSIDINEVINSTSDLLLTNTSVLTVGNINATQNGGVYECVVLNDAGFEVVQTTVYVRPVIVEQPPEIRTTNSTNVTLTCRAESFPYPRYQWQKYNTTAQSYQAIPEETGVDFMFTAQYNDFGDYRCMVTTPTINVVIYTDNATVHVSPSGSVMATPSIINNDEGMQAVFTCSAEGGPNNRFVWINQTNQTAPPVSTEPVFNLTATAAVGGVYTCTVSNLAGDQMKYVALNVRPVVVSNPMAVNVTRLQDNIVLTCSATGFPVPSITWYHNDTLVVATMTSPRIVGIPTRYEISSTLTITSANTNDTGDYYCNITNSVGTLSTSVALVLVQDIPEQPHSLMALNVTSRNLTLTWVEPHDNNAPITGYRVYYTTPAFFMGGVNVTVNVSGSIEQAFITDLHPGEEYTFTVDAFNDIGVSTISEPLTQRTDEERPASPPANIRVTAVQTMSVVVEWDEVPIQNRHGIIRGYTVGGSIQQFRTDSGQPRMRRFADLMTNLSAGVRECLMSSNRNESFLATLNDTQFSVTFDNLVPYAEYQFTVDAFTNVGRGDPAPAQNFSTILTNPEVVEQIQTRTDSTSLSVSWMPPDCPNGPISNYTIEGSITRFLMTNMTNDSISSELRTCLTSSGRLELLQSTVCVDQLTDRFSNLVPFAEYTFTITANTTGVGRGDTSSVQTITTGVARADPVQNLTVTTLNSTSLLLRWVAPDCPNGPISGYRVYYRQANSTQTGTIDSTGYITLTVNETSFTDNTTRRFAIISSLRSLRNYTIHVRALTCYNGDTLLGNADIELIEMLDTETTASSQMLIPPTVIVNGQEVPSISPRAYTVFSALPTRDAILANATGNVTVYNIVQVRHPLDSEIGDLGTALDRDIPPCNEDAFARICISVVYCMDDVIPETMDHGDGTDTNCVQVVDSGSRQRRQTGQTIQHTGRNIALVPLTRYCLAIKAEVSTDVPGVSLTRHVPLACPTETTRQYSVVGVVLGVILAFLVILCCIILLIVLCCYLKRRRKREEKYDVVETEMVATKPAVVNPASAAVVENGNEASSNLYETVPSGRKFGMRTQDFPAHVARMHQNNDYLFSNEFTQIEPSHSSTNRASYKMVNRPKNRYAQVTAYDHSRVVLELYVDNPGSDYINANMIDGYQKEGAFIATQAPLPDTVSDFWRMIWEKNVSMVVMLTNLEEKGKIRCFQYWPSADDAEDDQGLYEVQLVEEDVMDYYTIRTLNLREKATGERRTVKQFHYTGWSTSGSLPANALCFLKFIDKMTESHPGKAPVVVHCSAGVGRTGTFIAMHTQMEAIKAGDHVDVTGCVQYLRQRRCLMVQTEAEYIFIHDALVLYIHQFHGDSANNTYARVDDSVSPAANGYDDEPPEYSTVDKTRTYPLEEETST